MAVMTRAESVIVTHGAGVSYGAQGAPPPMIAGVSSEVTPNDLILRSQGEKEWSRAKERKFSALVEQKALRTATPAQLIELGNLQLLRRETKNAPSPEEVLFQYRRRQMEAKLLRQLADYVEFLQASSIAKA